MKNLFLLGALTIGGFAVSAQEAAILQTGIVHNETSEIVVVADDFSEIALSEVPQPVMDAIAKNFPTANLDKAYTNEEGQFKLDLSLEDGTSESVYADKDGNWLDL